MRRQTRETANRRNEVTFTVADDEVTESKRPLVFLDTNHLRQAHDVGPNSYEFEV
jgi:hypothetical protein